MKHAKLPTKVTRRSTFPITLAVNEEQHKRKLESFINTGYELVAENGYEATLAYYPYSGSYVKIVGVRNGKIANTLMLTPKQLQVIADNVRRGKKTRKG